MVDRSRWALLVFSAGLTALLGCVSNTTVDRLGADRQLSIYNVRSEGQSGIFEMARGGGSASGSSQFGGLLPGDHRSPGKLASKLSSLGKSASGAFKSAMDKMSDALAFKPRVTPASDPVKLSSMPDTLSPQLYVKAAAFSESQGNLVAAQSQYEKAMELAPQNAATLVAYARFRDRLGDSDQAIQLYQRARAQEPDQAIIWNDLALCHSRRAEFDQALAAQRQAVALQPSNRRYRNNLAAALVHANKPEDAVRELTSVYPEAIANHNVGYFLCRLNQYELAAHYLSQASRLDPTLKAPEALLAKVAPPQPARGTIEHAVGNSNTMPRLKNAAQPCGPGRATDNLRRLPPTQPNPKAELRRLPAP
jgi:tetratricopeptide (TPR) repeat protein